VQVVRQERTQARIHLAAVTLGGGAELRMGCKVPRVWRVTTSASPKPSPAFITRLCLPHAPSHRSTSLKCIAGSSLASSQNFIYLFE